MAGNGGVGPKGGGVHIEFDWHPDYLDYRRERGLDDDPMAHAAMTMRLAGLMQEYNRLTQGGEHEEAAAIVKWLVLPTHFIVADPSTGHRYECVQAEDGSRIRVVSAYAPEEVELEPRVMPEAPDA